MFDRRYCTIDLRFYSQVENENSKADIMHFHVIVLYLL
jgi:hypothetical protein